MTKNDTLIAVNSTMATVITSNDITSTVTNTSMYISTAMTTVTTNLEHTSTATNPLLDEWMEKDRKEKYRKRKISKTKT